MLGKNGRRIAEGDSDPRKVGTRRYICIVCGFIFDERLGDPDSGLPPGTLWEDIPDTWRCPVCKIRKSDFEPFEH